VNRLEAEETPFVRLAQEALLDQSLEWIELGLCHVFGGFEIEAADEGGQSNKEVLLAIVE
jgi:hypothetical protein